MPWLTTRCIGRTTPAQARETLTLSLDAIAIAEISKLSSQRTHKESLSFLGVAQKRTDDLSLVLTGVKQYIRNENPIEARRQMTKARNLLGDIDEEISLAMRNAR